MKLAEKRSLKNSPHPGVEGAAFGEPNLGISKLPPTRPEGCPINEYLALNSSIEKRRGGIYKTIVLMQGLD